MLNGQKYGIVNGFDLKLDNIDFSHSFSLSHVKKSIRNMIEDKIDNFLNAPHDSINFGDIQKIDLDKDIKIYWGERTNRILYKGSNVYSPRTESINAEFINSEKKLLISAKLQVD